MQRAKRNRLSRKELEEKLNSKGILTASQAKKVYMHTKINTSTETSSAMLHAKEDYQLSFEEFKQLFSHSALPLVKYKSVKSAEGLLKFEYHKAVEKAIVEKKEGVHITMLDAYRFRTAHRKATLAYLRHFNIVLD